MGDEYFAEGARSCDPLHSNEWIMKSSEPRICERVNYFVHPECGMIEGLYLTDSRCQPPPGFPFGKLSTTGSFIELKIDEKIFKMGETISISGNSYTTVGLPDEDLGIRVINSEGIKILEFKSKVSPRGDFQFNIQTGNTLSINVEDDYQLRVVNYGKYGSEIFQKFTVSNDGLPLPIKPEPIPVTSTTNTPESSNQIMVQVSEPNSSGINWTMIGGFVIVGIIIVWIIFKKIRSLGISSNDENYEEEYEENYNDPDDPMYPTQDDLENNFERYTWEQAEDLTAKLFRAKGYNATVGVPTKDGGRKRNGDFGIDVRANNGIVNIGIQVKHQVENVDFPDVAKTLGVAQKFQKVIIVSTKSGFSSQSWEHAGNNPDVIELWDSDRFKEEIKRHLIEKDNSQFEEQKSNSDFNYYEILGASRNDTPEEIKQKYKELSLKFHPDKAKSALSENNMKQVNEAYDTLKDPEKRNAYDQTLS